MADYKKRFRLAPEPLGVGGQAEVFRATDRTTDQVVALKRLTGIEAAAVDRMRREIEIQLRISHRNVMPVLAHDDEYKWYSMPLARRSLNDIHAPIADAVIADVIRDVASGLKAAHDLDVVHRDVKPDNIMQLGAATNESRWVVSDWGLLRKPLGETTARHTRTGVLLGTDGFAPPESYVDAHAYGPSGDVYSLGRVVAWAATGETPQPHAPLVPVGRWRRFVRLCTYSESARRPENMGRVLELLEHVLHPTGIEPDVRELVAAAMEGDEAAARKAFLAALEVPDDEELFIDELARLQEAPLRSMVVSHPAETQSLLDLMDRHLRTVDWGYRDFNYYNVPLAWIHQVARDAAEAGNLDLMEVACDSLFRLEPPWDRWQQAGRTRAWLAGIRGEAAGRVAEVLRGYPDAVKYYGQMNHAQDSRIRKVLRGARMNATDA